MPVTSAAGAVVCATYTCVTKCVDTHKNYYHRQIADAITCACSLGNIDCINRLFLPFIIQLLGPYTAHLTQVTPIRCSPVFSWMCFYNVHIETTIAVVLNQHFISTE
jgi:hypothetical protein